MAIEMYCDHCDDLIDENVNGAVRLKTGSREVVFHLCARCQQNLRMIVREFIKDSTWRETKV